MLRYSFVAHRDSKKRVERGPDAAELLAAIVDSSDDAIVSTALDGTVQTWNAGAERLFGYHADEAVGRPIAFVFPAARIGEERKIAARLEAGERIEHLETVRMRSDGQPIYVSVTVSPIRDESGAVVGASQIVRDETERRAAHRALRESEERFRTLVEQVEDYAIFGADTHGRATTWNEGVRRVLGFEEEEFLGRDLITLIFTPDDVAAGVPQRELEVAARTGTASNDRWMQRKDGARFFAAGVTTALRDEAGRLVGFTKVMRDWTERKRIEEALHRSEMRYRRLFESAKDGILIVDAEGRVIDANPLLTELLGATDGSLKGRTLAEIGLFGDEAATESVLLEVREKGEGRFDRLAVRPRADKAREVEVIANLYRENGRSVIQCNVRDVTERNRLERQTREQAAALADLDRRKDEFLAMLSHELRNPLAPIANAVQLLRLQKAPEGTIEEQARSIIERQVTQLSHLVDDLLEVSRITSGRFQLRLQDVVLNDVVERAAETVDALVAQRQHELTLTLPPKSPWVRGDAARLEQVVVNLLTNAVKYTEECGRIAVTVEEENGAAELRVRDSGIGIAPDLLPRIFDLFTQADRSLDRSEGGLGVGLSLVRRLVELHGGTVRASSVIGEGSEFVVRLPLVAASGPSRVAESKTTRPKAPGLRVLVVDDNVDAAASLAMLLRTEGHEIHITHDGPAALRVARELRPHVLFLDIGLPGLDGFEVAETIRRDPKLEGVLLVAMTGYGQQTDRDRSHQAGFDHHLVKPADFDQVRQILASVDTKPRS